ncbi:restriction endonuclease subunit S [Fibrobacter sp. UWH4]|uniref:restriction endonuclease subunit S n=1 Tax=Fibrobacter sp. UWH4 TaxID=1896210 RepID=UPI000922E521|nr:restriction endonuclease subunit S [Fibrobacter sp. UWH4]SHL55648.1 Type I restriction modification DNA specificity domain-containing protein [Fibrobacter sp. UWH4]
MIPSDWENGKLSDLGTIVAGGTPSKARSTYYTDNGIAWITPKDLSLHPNKFTSKGEIDISQEGYDNSSAKIMPKGTVLFSSRAPIGYISIAQNELCTNQGFKSVIPKVNVGTPYVYFYLKNHTEEIENKASGSTFKEASGSLMNGLEAIIPSNQILSKFNSLCNPIFEQQESLELENQRLVSLRDNLLPKLMSGEIDVADVRI